MDFVLNYRFLGNIRINDKVSKLTTAVEDLDWNLPDFGRTESSLKDGKYIVFPFVITSNRYDDTYSYITKDLCTDIISQIGDLYKECVFIRGEVAALLPGVNVLPHIDSKFFHKYSHRVHVPIKTNASSKNVFTNDEKHFELYSIYEINNRVMHHAYNRGTEPRVHLIFDLMPRDLFDNINKSVLTATSL